jgi:uncharacterized protein (DUF433 family)
VIEPVGEDPWVLSFRNLVEVFVLSSLRRKHGVRLPAVRQAIDYMRKKFRAKHPLTDNSFFTDGHDVFVEHYGRLISVSEDGQLAMKDVLTRYLSRVDKEDGMPVRLFPLSTDRLDGPKIVAIDPEIVFGQPCIVGTRIPTAIIAERYKAGDRIADLALDYGCEPDKVEEAVRYEFPGRAA